MSPPMDVDALSFHIEDRAGVPVLVWPGNGCRPATAPERELWDALIALRAERDALKIQAAVAVRKKDEACAERDALLEELDEVGGERDDLQIRLRQYTTLFGDICHTCGGTGVEGDKDGTWACGCCAALSPAEQPTTDDWCYEHGYREHKRGSPACERAEEGSRE